MHGIWLLSAICAPKEFDVDVGEPIGFCKETALGIFERNWTKTKVKLDCNRWIGNVTPHVASPERYGS